MGKGGSSPPPQPTQVSQLTIPEYAKPYMEKLLGQTEALTGQPLRVYEGERRAAPSQTQLDLYKSVSQMQTPGGFKTAQDMAKFGGSEALRLSQYTPSQFQMERVGTQPLQQFQMTAAQTGFRPDIQPAEQFTAETAQQYMSPYMQQVVDIQKRKAIEDAQQAQLGQNLAAARQGTYGGSRQAVLQAQREKALGENLSDIQFRGQQAAFEQAQQQFERDRAAKMQTQALSVDVGLKTALANLDADAQSRVQNLAAQLQTQGLSADQALRSALANQQQFADMQKMAEQSRQFGTETGLRGAEQYARAGALTGELAGAEAQANVALTQLQSQIASLEQQGRQAEIDALIAKFQEEQAGPFKQLGFMSDILRGTGSLAGGRAIYEAPQSLAQQAVGLGLPAYAMYRGLTQ
jgi:hypothetical protein